MGLCCGLIVRSVVSQSEDSQFKNRLEPFCLEFEYSLCACAGCLQKIWLKKHAMLNCDSKFTLSVSVCAVYPY